MIQSPYEILKNLKEPKIVFVAFQNKKEGEKIGPIKKLTITKKTPRLARLTQTTTSEVNLLQP